MSSNEARESWVHANGIRHHVIRWGEGKPVILCHGFLDFAWSWREVALELSARGFEAIAFDWRGHGESDPIGAGGYYHFPDYVRDLDSLLPQLTSTRPLLVGHSMGGTACSLFAGARPAAIEKLSILEGLGPPEVPAEQFGDRLVAWLDGMDRLAAKDARPIANLEEAIQRMRVRNPKIPDRMVRFLAEQATKPHPGGEGLTWRFDPLHRTTSPVPFNRAGFLAVLRRIEVETLVIAASDGFRLRDESDRMQCLRQHRFVEIPNASHMLHWDAPGDVARALSDFFS